MVEGKGDALAIRFGEWQEGLLPRETYASDEVYFLKQPMGRYGYGIYGRCLSGVISHADLAANKAGLQLYKDLAAGKFKTIRDYVTKEFCEETNPNDYTPAMKQLVEKNAQKRTAVASAAPQDLRNIMKHSMARTCVTLIFCLLGMTLPVFAQSNSVLPKIIGFVSAGGAQVVLELPPLRAGGGSVRTVILSEGEREAEVEVQSINLAESTVELIYYGSNVLVRMSALKPNAAARNQINLTNAPLDVVLKLFAEASSRTLLVHPLLPAGRLAITGSADDPAATAQIFAQALTNHGIAIIPDGEKFLQLVPQHLADKVRPRSQEIKPASPGGTAEANWPAGSVNLTSAHLSQVAKIYASFIGREFDRDSIYAVKQRLPDVAFKSHTALTTSEMIYALDVQFAWRGVKMAVVDEKLARLVPLDGKP